MTNDSKAVERVLANEMIEQAARAMYADVEVGEWERGDLETLLAYRRADRIALEAVLAYAVDQKIRFVP